MRTFNDSFSQLFLYFGKDILVEDKCIQYQENTHVGFCFFKYKSQGRRQQRGLKLGRGWESCQNKCCHGRCHGTLSSKNSIFKCCVLKSKLNYFKDSQIVFKTLQLAMCQLVYVPQLI